MMRMESFYTKTGSNMGNKGNHTQSVEMFLNMKKPSKT